MSRKDKRMDAFAREAFRLGALRCFKHFDVELRGREELLLTVHAGGGERNYWAPVIEPMIDVDAEPIPPASPCEREARSHEWNASPDVVFLIGCYAHYAVPLVWIRAGHSLVGTFHHPETHNAPVSLESTNAWGERVVRVWEVVAELVAAIACPAPSNPFELDQGALASEPASDALLMMGSLASYLREIHLNSARFGPLVEPDLMSVMRILAGHLEAVATSPHVAPLLSSPTSLARNSSRNSSSRRLSLSENSSQSPAFFRAFASRPPSNLAASRLSSKMSQAPEFSPRVPSQLVPGAPPR